VTVLDDDGDVGSIDLMSVEPLDLGSLSISDDSVTPAAGSFARVLGRCTLESSYSSFTIGAQVSEYGTTGCSLEEADGVVERP